MQCPNCSAVVREGSKFCVKRGTLLPHACPSCGHAAAPDDLFCAQCGASLRASQPQTVTRPTKIAPTAPPKSTATPRAERRQITVMFCHKVGSRVLSTQLDPEEQKEVVSAFQSACAAEVNRLDGMVAQYLGDGVLAYSGYPLRLRPPYIRVNTLANQVLSIESPPTCKDLFFHWSMIGNRHSHRYVTFAHCCGVRKWAIMSLMRLSGPLGGSCVILGYGGSEIGG